MYFFFAVILSVLMLDEAHERTLYTDIAIGLLKKVIPADSVSGTIYPFSSMKIILESCDF